MGEAGNQMREGFEECCLFLLRKVSNSKRFPS